MSKSSSEKKRKRRPVDAQSPVVAESTAPPAAPGKLARLRAFVPVAIIAALPVILTGKLWVYVWNGARSRAWDGSGHFAAAYIYSREIFPDTFGWTPAYFTGMPLPNFYPPLFYWCVAALHHAGPFSFATAFKLPLVVSVALMPCVIWRLAKTLAAGGALVGVCAALASVPLLVDYRLYRPIGLDYLSTFHIGLYTQPMGFVLLALWLSVHLDETRSRWRLEISAILLALTTLANFFNAATAGLFVGATLIGDLVRVVRARDAETRAAAWRRALETCAAPILAFLLTAFWTVPLVESYAYFVTRPFRAPLGEMIPPVMWIWYALAATGFWIWARRPTAAFGPFLATCAGLLCIVAFSSTVAPRWFPLQATRFVSTLNFLLAAPVGFALASGVRRLARFFGEKRTAPNGASRLTIRVAVAVGIVICLGVRTPYFTLAFFQDGRGADMDAALDFARERRDGRYLVEFPALSQSVAALSGRALTAYLGMQGNEAVSVVFREASPNSIFMNPLTTAFSASPDSFGMSSTLSDDLDFLEQPLSRHIARARFVGVKYFVIVSPWMKERFRGEASLRATHEFGPWTIFEVEDPPPPARVLRFKPALVVSDVSFKLRRRNEFDFTRLAEEQFADGWFDVALLRSPEMKLDRLREPERFGALIVGGYDCDDEAAAYAALQTFAQRGPVIFLASAAPLYRRIRENPSAFPLATYIERPLDAPGDWLATDRPSSRYDASDIRGAWRRIRRILEETKTPVAEPSPCRVETTTNRLTVRLETAAASEVPILLAASWHPNWRTADGRQPYLAAPFFMATFARDATEVTYGRSRTERGAVWLSGLTLATLAANWARRRMRRQRVSH
jgi:hypothetical protein